jgi:ActR/RegA family two-component response regulator
MRKQLTGPRADFSLRNFADSARVTAHEAEQGGVMRADISNTQASVAPQPNHVLVVEDNMIIALDTEDNLRSLGVSSIAVKSNVADALAAIEKRVPDFAIVDFNLGSESSAPVARALAQRGVRFVLATGYTDIADQLEELGAESLMRKPYGPDDIASVLTPAMR